MSDYHKIIRENAGIELEKTEEELQKQELKSQLDGVSRQLHNDWLRLEPTSEFFKSISTTIDGLETQARQAACAHHIHKNHELIIMLLVQAEQLRILRQTYGRHRDNSIS